MERKRWGNEYRTTIVCIDSYTEGVPVGRFYNPYAPQGEAFRSLSQFLLKMEAMLDGMNLPQSFSATRSFTRAPAAAAAGDAPPAAEVRQGALATFSVRVLFRQNTSWQGSVTWLEGKAEQSFRSVLELILLMDSALTGAD